MATHNVTLDIYVGGFNSPVTGPTVTVGDTITLTVTGSGVANGATATKSATSGCTAINVSVGTATANAVISFSGTSYSVTYSSTVANTATHTRTLTGTVTPAPTYSVTAPTSINEGSSGTINVTTANVADNTELYYKVEGVPYSTSNISAADFGGTVPSGPFTISSNAGSFTVTPTADLTTEGQETARVTIRTGSTSGTVVATDDFNVIDTSTTPAATYTLTAPTSIDEGSSGTINIATTNVATGTTLYWTVTSTGQFTGDTSGSEDTDSSGNASFSVTPTADSTTEGALTVTARIRTGSQAGPIVASDTFVINDTSTTPAADTTPAAFDLQDVGPVAAGTLATTTAVTITDMDANCPCSIAGQGSPQLTVGSGGVWTTSSTINPNTTINVRLTAPTAYSSSHTATLTIGTETDDITVTSDSAPTGGGGTSTSIAATAMVNGTSYSILTVGTTDFTSFGAANNNIGTVFTMSNAPGTGTGTVLANSTYGIKIFDTDGTTSVLSPNTRYMVRLTDPASISLAATTGSSTDIACNMTGLTTSNSDLIFEQFATVDDVPVTRLSNGFRVTNNSGQAFSNIVYVVRF